MKKRISAVLIISSLFILSVFTFVPDGVLGDTQTYVPNVDGHELDWTPKNAGDHYVEVDDPVGAPDEDDTYVSTDSFNQDEFWGITNPGESGTITNVRVYLRAKQSPSDEFLDVCLYTESTEYCGAAQTPTSSYANYYEDWANNPFNSNAWTWDNITALEIGARSQKNGAQFTSTIYITQGYAEVTYSAGAAASLTVTLRKSDNQQERIDVGYWGNKTLEPGNTLQNSTNFVRAQCDNCDGVDDSFWVNWSGTTWASTKVGDTINIDGNYRLYYYETSSGSADPDDGGWSWSDSNVDADGSYQITFTNSGTTYVWVRFRIEAVPSPLGGADDYLQDYTVELDR